MYNTAMKIIEYEVEKIAYRYNLTYEVYQDIDFYRDEPKFTIKFIDNDTARGTIFRTAVNNLNGLEDRVIDWINDIREVKEETTESKTVEDSKPAFDPLMEIAKQLRIANRLKIIELKHAHGMKYYRDHVVSDIDRIEKELKGE